MGTFLYFTVFIEFYFDIFFTRRIGFLSVQFVLRDLIAGYFRMLRFFS